MTAVVFASLQPVGMLPKSLHELDDILNGPEVHLGLILCS